MASMAKRSARAAAAAGCAAAALLAGSVAHGAFAPDGVGARLRDSAAPAADGTLQTLLDLATRDAERAGEAPGARRTRLLERIRNAEGCFIGNPTPAQLEAIAAYYGGRNPAERITRLNNRFFLDVSAWDGSGAAFTTQIGQAKPISLLTYSFPNDGVVWGPEGQLNRLSADLIGRTMPDTSVDPPLPALPGPGVAYGRELFRQVLAGWERACSVRYMEVCDDDAPWDPFPPAGPGTHGDIRFGSYAQGEGFGVLAFNYFPEFGGDMVLNSSYFVEPGDTAPPPYFSASNGYRYLRNVIAHEHGHGLGFRHVIPCSQTKLMEPFSSTVYDMVQIDEKRGAQHNYGDRFAGNQTREAARDLGRQWIITPGNPPTDSARYPSLGNANDPVSVALDHNEPALGLHPHSVLERDLSTNGPVINPGTMLPNPSGEDWFRFTIENPQRIVIKVTPTGDAYVNGQQVDGSPAPCSGPATSVNAVAIGNLDIQFFRDGEGTPFREANTNAAGAVETIDAGVQPAGTYYIRVFDSGGSASYLADQPTQLYDLSVRLGPDENPVKYSPYAVAGVDKYAPLGQYVQFIGDLLSRSQDPNSEPLSSRTANFEWDLDGDGTFEINIDSLDNPPEGQFPNNPRFPFALYTDQNRIIPVTLRVTDPAAGLQATDTIFVTVTGAPISVTSVTPAFAYRGTTIPITITGTGLGAVMALNQITVSGTGVTLGGVPVVGGAGTSITGLTITVAADAELSARDVRITDGCTAGFLDSAITVLDAVPAPPNDGCSAPDIWTAGPGCKPFDSRGATTGEEQDYTGSGCEGSTLHNDVWYVWTASQTGMLSVHSRSNEAGATPAPFPSVVAAYRLPAGPIACPPASVNLLACGEMFTLNVQIGDRLLFRVGGVNEGHVGSACVDLAFADLVGSCCNANTGACTMNVAPVSCDGLFNAANVCSPNPCPQPLRRCCYPSGQCSIITQADCIGGDWNPLGLTCAGNPCPQPVGSCCHADGSCTLSPQTGCSGSWAPGGACAPNPCPPPPPGACCLPDGQCVNATLAECSNGVFSPGAACTPASCQTSTGSCCVPDLACEITLQADCPGAWTADGVCDPDPCAQMTGACCTVSGCAVTTHSACAGGWTVGAVCTPDPCAQPTPGVCCSPTGDCSVVNTPGECTGTFSSSVTVCDPGVCPPPRGACCDTASGLCSAFVLQADCTSGAWHASAACSPTLCPPPSGVCCIVSTGACVSGLTPAACNGQGGAFVPGQTCSPSPCAQPGACCGAGGACSVVLQSACLGGTFLPAQTCTPDPCAQPTGACCDGTTCTLLAAAGCVAPAVFKGAGTVCGTPGNPTTCCPANFNGMDGVSVQDIFDFLGAYFAVDPSADFNGSGAVSVQDIFDFLAAYFAGCPSSGGACCAGTTCTVVTDAGSCSGGAYQGDGVACGPTGNPTTCCPANFNGVNGVGVQDLFDYLAAWQLQSLAADFNGDSAVTLEDLFAYLRAYFQGCPG